MFFEALTSRSFTAPSYSSNHCFDSGVRREPLLCAAGNPSLSLFVFHLLGPDDTVDRAYWYETCQSRPLYNISSIAFLAFSPAPTLQTSFGNCVRKFQQTILVIYIEMSKSQHSWSTYLHEIDSSILLSAVQTKISPKAGLSITDDMAFLKWLTLVPISNIPVFSQLINSLWQTST